MTALAAIDFRNPLFWAIMVGWIMTVVLHEFAHGIVAYWGGDYTIKERGGLTLNPFQYIDPLFSILLPIVFLAIGGIPLPGGSTYVHRELLRSRAWNSAVSLAGPVMNTLIFLGLCALLSQRVGWIDPRLPIASWTSAQVFVAGMAFLQVLTVIFNLVPIPPLDGFGIISPFLPADLRQKLSSPQVSNGIFFAFLFLMLWVHPVAMAFFRLAAGIIGLLGLDGYNCVRAMQICLWGS